MSTTTAFLNLSSAADKIDRSPPAVDKFRKAVVVDIANVTLGNELSGRQLFSEGDIGDVDNNGFPEFIDGWGRPINFVRWPAGFNSELQPVDPATGKHDSTKFPDPFDPRHAY